MAFKVVVSFKSLQALVDTDAVESVSVFQHLKNTVQYIDLQQTVAFQQLIAADVTIDADTLNRYFTASTSSPNAVSVTMLEATALNVDTARADIANISETLAFDTNLGTSDSISFGESVHTLITFTRAFSDSTSVAESSEISFSKNATDSATILESATIKIIPNRGLNVAAVNSSTLN